MSGIDACKEEEERWPKHDVSLAISSFSAWLAATDLGSFKTEKRLVGITDRGEGQRDNCLMITDNYARVEPSSRKVGID